MTDRPLNIVHYLKSIRLRDGGVVRAVLDITDALARRGHRITLATAHDDDVPADWPVLPAAPVTGRPSLLKLHLHRIPPLLTGDSLERLRATIGAADLVHIHCAWLPSNAQVASIAHGLGKPFILTPHGMFDDWCVQQSALKKRIYFSLIERDMLSHASGVHCLAQGELDQSRKWFPKTSGFVVPSLIDPALLGELPGPELARTRFPALSASLPNILFLSRLHPKKGPEHLLRAGALLRERGTPINILLAGPSESAAYETQLRELARSLKLDTTAHFLGMVRGQEKFSLYQAADLFVLPTSQENFGLVLVEALAAGTPIVTTKGVDIWPELLSSHAAAIYDDPSDIPALANAITSMLVDRARHDAMRHQARQWVGAALDPDRILAQMEAMYLECLNRPTHAAGQPG